MNIKKYIILGILIFSTVALFGEDGESGQAGAYLRLGYGVKALGMGSAFTAIANDGSALLWNPAGLSQLKRTEISGMYSLLSLNRQQNFASLTIPIQNFGSFGIGWLQYGVSDIDKRDTSGNPLGTFSDNEMAIIFGFGNKLGTIISYGASAKYLTHSIDDKKASGLGFDFGFIIHDLMDMISLGASLQSFSSYLKWDSDSKTREEIPSVIKTGLSIKIPQFPLLLAADYEIMEKYYSKLHLGAECSLLKILLLRAGYNGNNITAGCSFIIKLKGSELQLDYAYDPISEIDFSNHRVGISCKF